MRNISDIPKEASRYSIILRNRHLPSFSTQYPKILWKKVFEDEFDCTSLGITVGI